VATKNPFTCRAARRRGRTAALAALAALGAVLVAFVPPAHAASAPGPATVALRAIVVVQHQAAAFAYRINDQTSATAEVAIIVRKINSDGRTGAVVKSFDAGHKRPTNVDLSLRFTATWAPGRYRWYVYATDAAGLNQTSLGSNSLKILRPPFPSAAAIARAAAFLRARNLSSALAVVDSNGVLHGFNLDRTFTSASVVKAMLLVAYLRAHTVISSSMQTTLTLMITRSNNASAYRTYGLVGASGLYRLARLAGMKHFTAGGNVLYSRITASDQARYFFHMDSYIPAAHRAFARYLLSHIVPAQSWGIPSIARPAWHVYFKGGWFGAASDPFTLVNQVARLERSSVKWSLAVLTDHNPHSPYAFVTLQGVTSRLLGY
jgi:hypothetical protein